MTLNSTDARNDLNYWQKRLLSERSWGSSEQIVGSSSRWPMNWKIVCVTLESFRSMSFSRMH